MPSPQADLPPPLPFTSTSSRARTALPELAPLPTLAASKNLDHSHWVVWISILSASGSCLPTLPPSFLGQFFELLADSQPPRPSVRGACLLPTLNHWGCQPALLAISHLILEQLEEHTQVTTESLLPGSGIGNLPHFRGTSCHTDTSTLIVEALRLFPGIPWSLPRICFSCRKIT